MTWEAAALTMMGLSGVSSAVTSLANADVAEQEADSIIEANTINEQTEADRVRSLLASQRAAASSSGIDWTGSPLAVSLDTQRQYRRDASVRRYNAQVDAGRARSKAGAFRGQAIGTLLGTAAEGIFRYKRK